MPFRYLDYPASRTRPNVVVDGSPNEATVLTLTHWPGIAPPEGLEADLSAQMAFEFMRRGSTVSADVVTNNHFDQDGLVSMFALIDPDRAFRHHDVLIDLAAAGDFATYRDRRAARASMAIAAFADAQRSPIAAELTGTYDEQCAVLYSRLLDLLPELVLQPERHVELWADEDRDLTASEEAIASGAITIEERTDLDLAVVSIDPELPSRRGHRFAGESQRGVHPMAINNATGCFRVLQIHGQHFAYTDRYESWVQYRTRTPLPRVDLRPLADELNELDTAGTWAATAPSSLTPRLETTTTSRLDPHEVETCVANHLRSAPPAWNPYRPDP